MIYDNPSILNLKNDFSTKNPIIQLFLQFYYDLAPQFYSVLFRHFLIIKDMT